MRIQTLLWMLLAGAAMFTVGVWADNATTSLPKIEGNAETTKTAPIPSRKFSY